MEPGEFSRLCSGGAIFLMAILTHSTTAIPLVLPEDAKEYTTNYSLDEKNTTFGPPKNTTDPSTDDSTSANSSMSIMWYLVSFGGLVTFFLLLSFSEFCCKKSTAAQTAATSNVAETSSDQLAPPPYELFAPPAYESLFRDITRDRKRSIRASVFLIPVHDKAELPRESPLEFGEVIRRNPMGDGEVVTPPPPP